MEILNISELNSYSSPHFINKNAFAPQYPFRYLVVGSSGGGKTNMISCLILKYIHFDKIYVYSKHLEQPCYNFLRDFLGKVEKKLRKRMGVEEGDEREELQIYNEYDALEDVVPIDEVRGEGGQQTLVIFDDFNFAKNQNPVIEYFSRGRHKNVSSIYIAQSYFQTPKSVRINCNFFSFFSIPSSREINLIIQDLPIPVDKETLKELFKQALKKRFNFLTIDLRSNVLPMMIRRNFDELFVSEK